MNVMAAALLASFYLAATPSAGLIEFYEDGNYGLKFCSCVIRIYLHERDDEGNREVRFLGDLARGRHRLNVKAPEGEHSFIIIVEPATKEADPAITRDLPRLHPNVTLEVLSEHATRVRIGLVRGLVVHPFDRRSVRGELGRRALRPPPDFESPNASPSLPSASQFATEIQVEAPRPLEER